MPIQPDSETGRRRKIVLGIVVVLLAAVAVYVNVSFREKPITPVTRTPRDFILTWRCLACGYEHDDRAGPGPKPCPKCGKTEFYASVRFNCPKHGDVRVAYDYTPAGDVKAVKVADKPWLPQIDPERKASNVVCPLCGFPLMPAEAPRAAEPPPGAPDS